jgi:hypothetical protein
MSMHRRHRRLVKESAVYLSGRYAEYVETRNRPIPDWAWLSTLAHASPEQLRQLADQFHRGGTRTRATVWWQAVAFLAGEILSQHDDDRSLDELRRSVLVPLELEWLSAGRRLQRPRQLVRMVLDALDQYQDSQRR